MSDKDDKPSTSTSTVPLKKETVRISLRAQADESGPVAPKGSTVPISVGDAITGETSTGPIPGGASTEPIPGGAGTAPIAPAQISASTTGTMPSSEVPAPPAPPSPSPMAPSGAPAAPPAPSPTPPPAPSGAPTPPPAPSPTPPPPAPSGAPTPPPGPKTIPLSKTDPLGPTAPVSTSAAPASPIGAKTIPLAKAPSTLGATAGPVGKATTPLQQGGAKPLPQATVKMGKTQPMGSAKTPTSMISQSPNIQSTAVDTEEEWEEVYEEPGLMPFAVIVLLLALAVLAIELVTKMG